LEAITGKDPGDKKYQIKKPKHNANKTERKPKPITSVFVTGLPLDTDLEEVMEVFKKGGVFMEDENGKSRRPL